MRWVAFGSWSLVASLSLGCANKCADAPAPAPPVADGEAAQGQPVTIVFVRHAEKADDGTEDPPLTEEGHARAQCLVTMLRAFGATHLFATQYQRTQATLEPLGEATGLSIETIDASDEVAWLATLYALPGGSRAVVAAHSNTIPAWVRQLEGDPGELDAQGNIPHDEYDRMIHMVRMVGMVPAEGRTVVSVFDYCASP
jgi:phosphohistidine phosphatase SixA